MTQLVPRTHAVVAPANTDVVSDLVRFQEMILNRLDDAGLPTDSVLVEVDERHTLLSSVGGALRSLPVAERGESLYISKMIVAGAVGLFDAALNYLWNEVVNELRKRVVGYDLGYFFDIAVVGDMRKHFTEEDDLARVQDQDLLRACREIGLLSDVGFAQIDNIRFSATMRARRTPTRCS